ncbi:MAG: hypothetical protein NT049_02455 [Planctomycetota bacterium]|nr:hypothetical protein [Planctomycetota bacterium]
MTVNGAIAIGRRIYWSKAQGADGRLDRWLGIVDARISVGARELCCRATLGGLSFIEASGTLWRLGQIRVCKDRLRQIAEGEGRRVLEAQRTGDLTPAWDAAQGRLTLGCDGVMVPVVTAAEKQKRRARRRRRRKARRCGGPRHRGSDQGFKEFKIAAFYNRKRERYHVVGTAGNHEALGRLMRREAGRLKINEAITKVAVTDGAEWIRRQIQTRLPMVDAHILDYYHLKQHVGEAALVCFGEANPAGEAWRTRLTTALYEEGAAGLLLAIHETLRSARARRKRDLLRKLEQYVAKRATMLDYPTFVERDFDVGSGPTEAACKTLTLRLKGRGRRWDRPNAEAVMALEALRQSRLWLTYWNRERTLVA